MKPPWPRTHPASHRLATTGLLMVLATLYPHLLLLAVGLVFLDIFSHWFQMYSTLLVGSTTHKVRHWYLYSHRTENVHMHTHARMWAGRSIHADCRRRAACPSPAPLLPPHARMPAAAVGSGDGVLPTKLK